MYHRAGTRRTDRQTDRRTDSFAMANTHCTNVLHVQKRSCGMQTNVAVGLTSLELKDANLSPECTKSRHLEIQIRKNFLGRGHNPIPSPHLTPLGAFGASILAPTALELGDCGASSLAFPLLWFYSLTTDYSDTVHFDSVDSCIMPHTTATILTHYTSNMAAFTTVDKFFVLPRIDQGRVQ